jgi:hypothetical protein
VKKKSFSSPARVTDRLAHTLVVISLSVVCCGVFTSWMSVNIDRLLLISKQLTGSGLHVLGSAQIRIGGSNFAWCLNVV